MQYFIRFLLFVTVGLCAFEIIALANWPDFRGPDKDGIVPEEEGGSARGVPVTWSETEGVKWKIPIEGRAWSSPVIFGDQIWLTTATKDGHKLSIICVERHSGRKLHERVIFHVAKPRPLGNKVNTYASPSPVIEEGRVYVHFGSYGTACVDTTSFETIWERRDLECNHYRGPGSSPLLYKNMLILTFDGVDYQYVVALKKNNGETIWKRERSTDFKDLDVDGKPKAEGDFRKSYFTPIVIEANDKFQLISPAAKAAWSHDVSNGEELWHIRYEQFSGASRPVYDPNTGLLFINSGFPRPVLYAVRPDGEGDVTGSHVVWSQDSTMPRRTSPILVDGYLYLFTDGGIVSCVEAVTGAFVWKNRVDGQVTASPIYVDGRIYCFDEGGETTVIKPGDKYRVLASNKLEDGAMASPAVVGGSIVLRTKRFMYCLGD